MQEIDHSANPFPGLRPFESSEMHLFFGRDGQSEELLRRLKRTRFLAVVGGSGSGKSSLVRAGLLPALQGGLMASAGSDWRIAILRPGVDPIGNLARALASKTVLGSADDKSAGMQDVMTETTLRRSSLGLVELVSRARAKLDKDGQPFFRDYENLLVVVDQFEELFRFKNLVESSKEDAAAFVKLLLAAGSQKAEKIYIVLTMRSDFLGDCSQFFELPEAINDGQYLIPRMTRDQRREAISGPVAVGQGAISEPLVNQLLNDVGDNPDQLPILQHALMRTWDHWLSHRNGEPMDIPDYNAIGRMAEALSRHADEAYAELSDSQKVIAEKLFKGLTEKGTDNREIRRPMEVQEICELTGASEAAVIAVIEVFRREGRSFLMPPPTDPLTGERVHLDRESLIDISHESLIRNWERLKTWVDDESRSARIYRRLAETAVLHKEGGAGLWRDPDLGVALSWRELSNPNDVWAKRYHPEFPLAMSFLDESVAARDAQIASEEARRRKEIRRTRLTALVFGVAFILTLVMGVFAYGQKNKAQAALAEAKTQQEKAEAALEQAEKDRRAAKKAEAFADEKAFQTELQRQEAAAQALRAEQNEKKAANEKLRAEAEAKKAIQNENTAVENARVANEQIVKNKALLYASNVGIAQKAIADVNTERAQKLLMSLYPDPSKSAGPVASGTFLPEQNADLRGFEWYYLWRLASRKLATIKLGESASSLPYMKVEPLKLADPVLVYTGRHVAPIAFGSEVPEQIVAAGSDNIVRMWVGFSSNPLVKLPAQKEKVKAVTALGLYQFITADRTAVKVWSLPDPSQHKSPDSEPPRLTATAKLKGNDAHIALDVVEDKNLLAVGNGSTFLLWNLREKEPITLADGGSGYPSVHFVEKGAALITCDGKKLTRWNVRTRQSSEIELLDKGSVPFEDRQSLFIKSLAFTPDGRTMVTASNTNFRVWTAANAEATAYTLKTELRAHRQNFFSYTDYNDLVVAISPDGQMLATGDGTDLINGGGVRVWDITHKELAQLINLSPDVAYATSLDFSSDSQTLAVGSGNALQLWDVSNILPSREPLDSRDLPVSIREGERRLSALSPDGQLEAVAGGPYSVQWWNPKSDPSLKPAPAVVGTISTHSTAFSPDGTLLAVGGGGDEADNGVVTLWDTKSQKLKADLKGHRGVSILVQALAFSRDSKTLLTGANDNTVEVWDVSSKPARLLAPPLEGHKYPVTSVAFSPDGKTIASGDEMGLVNLWSASSYQLLMTLKVSERAIMAVTFSTDGNTLYTRDQDGEVLLWPAAKREQVDRLLQQARVPKHSVLLPTRSVVNIPYAEKLSAFSWFASEAYDTKTNPCAFHRRFLGYCSGASRVAK